MLNLFLENLSAFKKRYDQALDPVAQACGLTRMELDLLLFLHNNPSRNTAAEAVRLRRWTKSHVSAAARALQDRGLLSAGHPPGNRKVIRLTPLPAAGEILRQGLEAQARFFAALSRGVTPEERRSMEQLLEKIARNLRDYEET